MSIISQPAGNNKHLGQSLNLITAINFVVDSLAWLLSHLVENQWRSESGTSRLRD